MVEGLLAIIALYLKKISKNLKIFILLVIVLKKGNGEYGSLISYYDSNNRKIFKNNGDLAEISGEYHSDHSFCVLSSLFPINIENLNHIQIQLMYFVIKCIAQKNH